MPGCRFPFPRATTRILVLTLAVILLLASPVVAQEQQTWEQGVTVDEATFGADPDGNTWVHIRFALPWPLEIPAPSYGFMVDLDGPGGQGAVFVDIKQGELSFSVLLNGAQSDAVPDVWILSDGSLLILTPFQFGEPTQVTLRSRFSPLDADGEIIDNAILTFLDRGTPEATVVGVPLEVLSLAAIIPLLAGPMPEVPTTTPATTLPEPTQPPETAPPEPVEAEPEPAQQDEPASVADTPQAEEEPAPVAAEPEPLAEPEPATAQPEQEAAAPPEETGDGGGFSVGAVLIPGIALLIVAGGAAFLLIRRRTRPDTPDHVDTELEPLSLRAQEPTTIETSPRVTPTIPIPPPDDVRAEPAETVPIPPPETPFKDVRDRDEDDYEDDDEDEDERDYGDAGEYPPSRPLQPLEPYDASTAWTDIEGGGSALHGPRVTPTIPIPPPEDVRAEPAETAPIPPPEPPTKAGELAATAAQPAAPRREASDRPATKDAGDGHVAVDRPHAASGAEEHDADAAPHYRELLVASQSWDGKPVIAPPDLVQSGYQRTPSSRPGAAVFELHDQAGTRQSTVTRLTHAGITVDVVQEPDALYTCAFRTGDLVFTIDGHLDAATLQHLERYLELTRDWSILEPSMDGEARVRPMPSSGPPQTLEDLTETLIRENEHDKLRTLHHYLKYERIPAYQQEIKPWQAARERLIESRARRNEVEAQIAARRGNAVVVDGRPDTTLGDALDQIAELDQKATELEDALGERKGSVSAYADQRAMLLVRCGIEDPADAEAALSAAHAELNDLQKRKKWLVEHAKQPEAEMSYWRPKLEAYFRELAGHAARAADLDALIELEAYRTVRPELEEGYQTWLRLQAALAQRDALYDAIDDDSLSDLERFEAELWYLEQVEAAFRRHLGLSDLEGVSHLDELIHDREWRLDAMQPVQTRIALHLKKLNQPPVTFGELHPQVEREGAADVRKAVRRFSEYAGAGGPASQFLAGFLDGLDAETYQELLVFASEVYSDPTLLGRSLGLMTVEFAEADIYTKLDMIGYVLGAVALETSVTSLARAFRLRARRGRPAQATGPRPAPGRTKPSPSTREWRHVDVDLLTAVDGTVIDDVGAFGMTKAAAAQFRRVADRYQLRIRVRPANPASRRWLEAGHPPKHVKLKSKTINDLDIELGARPGSNGLVGYFEPTLPEKYRPFLKLPEAERPAIIRRYAQRLDEFYDYRTDIERLKRQGLISIEDGVVIDRGLSSTRIDFDGNLVFGDGAPRGGTGKAFTGDFDVYDITHPDGRTIQTDLSHPDFDAAALARKEAAEDALRRGPVQMQHDALLEWRPESPKDKQNYLNLRGRHVGERRPDGNVGPVVSKRPDGSVIAESEALLEFNVQQPPRASYHLEAQ